jgi:hypothetical protein
MNIKMYLFYRHGLPRSARNDGKIIILRLNNKDKHGTLFVIIKSKDYCTPCNDEK